MKSSKLTNCVRRLSSSFLLDTSRNDRDTLIEYKITFLKCTRNGNRPRARREDAFFSHLWKKDRSVSCIALRISEFTFPANWTRLSLRLPRLEQFTNSSGKKGLSLKAYEILSTASCKWTTPQVTRESSQSRIETSVYPPFHILEEPRTRLKCYGIDCPHKGWQKITTKFRRKKFFNMSDKSSDKLEGSNGTARSQCHR